jgi:hypothetical protein
MSYLLTQYGVELEIDTTPFAAARSFAPVCDGFNNLTEQLNEQVQEYYFLCGRGFGSDEVTGLHPNMQLTGVRKIGDTAQDFIFGQRFKTMDSRKTTLRLSVANADGTITRYTNRVTMKNISSFGGATTDGAAVSVDFSFNGPPIVETLAATAALTVTSVAGAEVGQTVLTVVPTFPDAGCKFVYKVGASAPAASAGDVLADGWNDFVNGGTYQIASGQYATVAQINVATYACTGSGNAEVVAKA